MPTYQYECTKCGYTFEAFQKITDEPVKLCPKCGSPVKRLISGGMGIIFKGSGFYTTDYKRSSINTSSRSESSDKHSKGEKNNPPKKKEDSKGTEKKETKT
ncbi:MAG: zinc ribbon domain-containing protein [Spirochaetes bacterium]|nr:MAG: zinc ribbon domain-containing protein [Spirochaetota bacterium]